MSKPLTITATVAAWIAKHRSPAALLDLIKKGENLRAISECAFYGAPEMEKFGDWIRIGEADITLRLLPRDDMTRLAVRTLQAQLDEERAKWLTIQAEIMANISKLQAIEYTAEA